MNRSIAELHQLDARTMPDDDHLDRGQEITPAEFDEWMERIARSTRHFKPRVEIDLGQATIEALRSLQPTSEG